MGRQDLLSQDVAVPAVTGQFLNHVQVDPAQGQWSTVVVHRQVVE